MKRTFVLDTNVLLDDQKAVEAYDKSRIVIPFKVVEELDAHKTAPGQLGGNARAAIRMLDSYSKLGDISVGVNINKTTSILVAAWTQDCQDLLEKNKLQDTPDNRIIVTALVAKGAVMVSNDLALRLKAVGLGIKVAAHTRETNANSVDEIYSGLAELDITEASINSLYSHGEIAIPRNVKLMPNQYVHLRSNSNDKHTAIGRTVKDKIVRIEGVKEVFSIKPRNMEQVSLVDAILDESIQLVTALGPAGGGKSLIALAAALELTLHRQIYKKLILIRSLTSVGDGVGWLPGALEEKQAPYFQSFMDNLEVIFKAETTAKLQGMLEQVSDKLEFTPPTFMRGRSLPGTLLIIDECQNLSQHEVKTIATRLGEGSKIIMIGDVNQIDVPKLDALNNGFTKIIEAFKDYDCAAHITLNKCERSDFAALAAKLL